jgi:hypothetical protein
MVPFVKPFAPAISLKSVVLPAPLGPMTRDVVDWARRCRAMAAGKIASLMGLSKFPVPLRRELATLVC